MNLFLNKRNNGSSVNHHHNNSNNNNSQSNNHNNNNNNAENDSTDTTIHSQNFLMGLEDSGIATSNDVHSLEYDDHPITPPPVIVVEYHQNNHLDHQDAILEDVERRIINPPALNEKIKYVPCTAPSVSINSQSASTIRQHYYPEAGWGFIILFIGLIVQLLTHGIQQSFGILLIATKSFYKNDNLVEIGKLNILLSYKFILM